MKDKRSEKEEQIERLILEGGTYNIMEILHMLKEKGHRMRKKDLLQFIEGRNGHVWEEVRQRINRRMPQQTTSMNHYLKPTPAPDPQP